MYRYSIDMYRYINTWLLLVAIAWVMKLHRVCSKTFDTFGRRVCYWWIISSIVKFCYLVAGTRPWTTSILKHSSLYCRRPFDTFDAHKKPQHLSLPISEPLIAFLSPSPNYFIAPVVGQTQWRLVHLLCFPPQWRPTFHRPLRQPHPRCSLQNQNWQIIWGHDMSRYLKSKK